MNTRSIPPYAPFPGRGPAPDLATEIAALLYSGCSIKFEPTTDPYGAVRTDVIVTAPKLFDVPTRDELTTVRLGGRPTSPIVKRRHALHDVEGLAAWLQQARLFVTR